ncbi:MAG: C25 family cysteine peptidase [Candidatus Poribacteria bacterium]|nr:C25 family cysteine peptidase [Candidatus Poribacteria bacterium]
MQLYLKNTKEKNKPGCIRVRLGVMLCIPILFFFLWSSSASARVTQSTSAEGITLQFTLPELTVSETVRDNVRYHEAHYADCHFTAEPGNPKVPVTRLMLGIPATATIEAVDVSAAPTESRPGVRLLPVSVTSYQLQEGSSLTTGSEANWPLVTSSSQRWVESGSAYQSNTGDPSYPGLPLARIIREGYIRSQRIIALALYPVQYSPKTRQLRLYSRFTVSIRFSYGSHQLSAVNRQIESVTSSETSLLRVLTAKQARLPTAIPAESEAFERALSHQLLNAEQAAHFRAPQPQVPAAPTLVSNNGNRNPRYKLFVGETGIYAVTAESLARDWGVELIGTNPARFRITQGNRDIPIYITGVEDGKFDPGDTIFFLGNKPRNPYSRWNIYWLALDGSRVRTRVPQLAASPTDPTATQIPTFRSKVNFEEDYLTNNLEFVYNDDKHKWFEENDFWYWDGIKNGGDAAEMRLEFPLYDVAKSFDPSHISVELQGGTPVPHQILVSVNGVRIEVAEWNQQDTLTVDRFLRTWNILKDDTKGELNVLSLARVDDNVDEDTTRYPYHVYLNRFSVEYTRLFRAVADELWFRSPTEDDTSRTQLPGGRKLQYKIEAFRDPGIHIFETDGTYLTARLRGFAIETDVTRTGMYNALFQVPDTRKTQFIAVSDTALRQPERIEIVEPTDLATATHGADYVVITHRKFLAAAERLAGWRETSGGGGHRTKVVTTDDIYNTYGDGGVNPKAIKDFLTHAYQSWTPPAPTYVVLLGDGTYDFRGIDTEIHTEPPELDGYIPTHYIRTDSFGRTASDHWYVTISGHDEFTDMYIGRLSAETVSQADAIVNKILDYEQSPLNGDWRRKIISVADDEVSNSGDFIFRKSLNEIAKDHTRLGYETIEIFLEDITDEVEAKPEDYPDVFPQRVAKDRIIEALGEGAVIAQYAGHGGNTVWAHEIIFDNVSVDQVEETGKIPFMLVLSCYNGYFDKPGEPSMAEKLLRKERGGIIGMLSATRLTYGSGNDALNRIIFDMIFKRNVRQLGPLSFDSKVELLMTEGTGQIDVMMEYTLFGDPALQIAIANGEIRPAIETKTVAPGDTLRIAPGYIQTATYDASRRTKRFVRDTDFDGTLTVKALFPGKTAVSQGVAGPVEYYTGDVSLTKTLTVSRGAYPAVTFTVPRNIASGDAHVEYYAQSDAKKHPSKNTVAVGGDGFTVNVPKILDIHPELIGDDKFRISVQVSDENEQSLLVVLEWRNLAARQWEIVELIPREAPVTAEKTSGGAWWTTPEPLNAPTDGSVVRYEIRVTDSDGNITVSDRLEYYPYVYPNLSVVQVGREDVIGYGYNSERKQWYLSADVQIEGPEVQNPIEVVFFSGNPDVDDDMLVDGDARSLGTARIRPEDWIQRTPLVGAKSPRPNGLGNPTPTETSKKDVYEPDPLNTLPIATATLNLTDQLPLGTHDIFAYVDATRTEADQPGEVLENDEKDNIAYRRISVNMGVVGTAAGQIISLDRNCVVTAPPDVLRDTETVLSIRPLDKQRFAAIGTGTSDAKKHPSKETINQITDVSKRAPLPGKVTYGYELAISNQQSTVDGFRQEADFLLASPVAIDLSFDFGTLSTQLAEELLGSSEEVTEGLGVASTIDTAVIARVREMGVYMFSSVLGNWVRLPSQQLTDASGALQKRLHVANMSKENVGITRLNDVRIQPEGTRTGKYVLFFTGPRTYRLLLAPFTEDSQNLGALEVISPAEQLVSFSVDFPNWKHGLSLNMEQDFEQPFRFGDIWAFNITALNQPLEGATNAEDPSQQELRWYASGFRDTNHGSGTINYIELPPDTAMPEDRWFVLFLTDTEFQIEGEKTGILRSQSEGIPLRGTAGQPFVYEPYGLRFQLTQGERPFTPGDRFSFETRPIGIIRATTDRLGPVTLVYSDDTVPPDIQLTIGNQQHFVPGDATDPEPLIGATLTDPSGLDYLTRPLLLELGRVSGEFERILPEAYQLTYHPGSNQLVLTYPSPELEPREYELRLTASDVHGNTDTKRITFRVHDDLQLLSFLNYPNPFPRKTTITCELTAPADSIDVKIYTLSGRLIRELSIPATPGFLMVEWDGRDADGVEVANGVYYAKLKIQREGEKDITEILKMMKLR